MTCEDIDMAAAAGAPSAYSTTKLDAHHTRNFDFMLRSLRLGAGGNALGGAQSTFNEAPGATVVTRDRGGLETEAKAFQPMAYGATIGLIYYRMIGNQHRMMWDEAIYRQLRGSMISHSRALDARRDLAYGLNANPASARDPAWIKSRDNNAQTIQNYARYADFLATLQAKKMAVFPGMSDAILNDPLVIGANPWCLGTQTEFSSAYKQVIGTPAHADPSFLRGTQAEQESLMRLAEKMTEVAVEAKAIEYLTLFLEKTSELLLKGSLRAGMSFVCKFPFVDIAFDLVKDLQAKKHLVEVQKLYQDDMERRDFLYKLGWGIWPKPRLDGISGSDMRSYNLQK